jgi:hypothetical protein
MTPTELTPNRTYFFCAFASGSNDVPVIDTYRYIGLVSDVLGGPARGKREYIFQDAEAYYAEQRGELSKSSSATERGLVLVAEEEVDALVQDYDEAIQFLESCRNAST